MCLVLTNSLTIKYLFLGSVIFRNYILAIVFFERGFEQSFERGFELGFEHGFERDFEHGFEHELNSEQQSYFHEAINELQFLYYKFSQSSSYILF